MNGTRTSLCVLALLLCAAGINAGGGGAAGNAGSNSMEYRREQKIQSSLLNSHAAITAAATAPRRGSTARATTLAQMLANAAADPTMSSGAMSTMVSIAGEAPRRRILGETTGRFEDDRLRSAMYQVASTIDKAVDAGTVKGAKMATRAGRDMVTSATMPGTYFNIDHVPDMDMRGRKLSGSRPDMEPTWSLQNTAENIAMNGARATRWGSINAGAASGRRGNTYMTEKMGDAIAHQRGNEVPRRLLKA